MNMFCKTFKSKLLNYTELKLNTAKYINPAFSVPKID